MYQVQRVIREARNKNLERTNRKKVANHCASSSSMTSCVIWLVHWCHDGSDGSYMIGCLFKPHMRSLNDVNTITTTIQGASQPYTLHSAIGRQNTTTLYPNPIIGSMSHWRVAALTDRPVDARALSNMIYNTKYQRAEGNTGQSSKQHFGPTGPPS